MINGFLVQRYVLFAIWRTNRLRWSGLVERIMDNRVTKKY